MSYDKPLPDPSALTQPFWDGTREGELRVQRCRACGATWFPPQVLCRHCLSDDIEWMATTGRGTVYTYSVVHRPSTPAFAGDVPYVVAVVELAEGPLVLTNIVGCDPADVHVGAAAEVTFVVATDEITLYPFRLVQ